MLEFPKDFLWGAATSAHQVEGNNTNSDWWDFEAKGKIKFTSGQACRHYELYSQDFDQAQELNHNCHRLSIEWSRIEPVQGSFSESEINHYTEVIDALVSRGLEPVVTLHHFTSPAWFSKLGGWSNHKADKYFASYVEKIVNALAKKVKFWVTINEPNVFVYYSYVAGDWPPQEKSYLKANAVFDNLAKAHIRAYRLIRDIYEKNNLTYPLISIAHNMQAFVACRPTLRNRLAVYLRHKFFNLNFIDKLIDKKALDFIGLNYYSRSLVDSRSWTINGLLGDTCRDGHLPLEKNSMGWDIYPDGLYDLLMQLKKYKLPVFILENGICTKDDSQRWRYIEGHLKSLNRAMKDGVSVLGYIYWSLLDNFEWDKGFTPRFGLVNVDYTTYKRTVRESAYKFALVCKTGKLDG